MNARHEESVRGDELLIVGKIFRRLEYYSMAEEREDTSSRFTTWI
jgi:hypothetical protein